MDDTDLVVVSNLSFLIPAAIAIATGYNTFALLVIVTMIFSIVYHVNKNQPSRGTYLKLDYFFAYVLLVANTFLIFEPEFHDNVYFYLALFISIFAVRMYFKDGVEYYKHAYWHILSSIVTLFSLLAAVTG